MIETGSSVPVTDFSKPIEGINIKDFWTLVGITDGAPPAPIDWETWESNHQVTFEPTELVLEYSAEGLISVESSTENSYASGHSFEAEAEFEKIPIISKLNLSGGYSSKHGKTNESVNKLSITKSYELNQSIGLNESSQENAYYFYLAPTIKRYHYKMYPWWNTNDGFEILGVDDYMFRVTNNSFMSETRPLSGGIHQIADPNDPDMTDWVKRGKPNEPNTIAHYANNYDLSPIKLIWNTGEVEEKLTTTTTKLQKQEYSFENEVEASVAVGIPIFKFDAEKSHSIKYSVATEVESTMDKSITIKYEVGNPEVGFMCNHLNLDTYLFTPSSDVDWWYYDSVPNNFKPWYISYAIADVSEYALNLTYPAPNQQFISGKEQAFRWTGNLAMPKSLL